MRHLMPFIAAFGLAAGLAGCASGVSLTPLDGGEAARGTTTGPGKPMAVKLDGKTYHGRWRTDGGADTAAPATMPVRAPIQVGRYYGQRAAGGSGVAELTAKDGSKLVCRFGYARGDYQTKGLCQSDQGRSFSMLVN